MFFVFTVCITSKAFGAVVGRPPFGGFAILERRVIENICQEKVVPKNYTYNTFFKTFLLSESI